MTSLRLALALLARPISAWHAIADRPPSLAALAFGYVLPLALLGPVATYVARRFVGIRVGHVLYRSSHAAALSQAVFAFVFELAGVVVVALLIDVLAPLFGARRSFGKALRIAAFAYTPVWVAAVTVLVPRLGFLELLAFGYELFLLHAGLAAVMHVPRGRSEGLAACAVAGTILAAIGFGELSAVVLQAGV